MGAWRSMPRVSSPRSRSNRGIRQAAGGLSSRAILAEQTSRSPRSAMFEPKVSSRWLRLSARARLSGKWSQGSRRSDSSSPRTCTSCRIVHGLACFRRKGKWKGIYELVLFIVVSQQKGPRPLRPRNPAGRRSLRCGGSEVPLSQFVLSAHRRVQQRRHLDCAIMNASACVAKRQNICVASAHLCRPYNPAAGEDRRTSMPRYRGHSAAHVG